MTKNAPRPRLPVPPADQLTPAQQNLVAAISAGPRGNFTFGGPFGVWLHAPDYGLLAQALGGYLRYKTSLPPRLSEFAILVVAEFWRAQFEFYAHAPLAQKAGVDPQTIADLRAGHAPTTARPDEMTVYRFARELVGDKRVSEATYGSTLTLLGERGTVELVGILGYYCGISLTLNAFNVPLPDGAELPFSEPT